MTEILSAASRQNFIGGAWTEQRLGRDLREAQSMASVRGDRGLRSLDRRGREGGGRAPPASAFPGWAALPAPARAAFFFKAADAIEARVEQIAQDMTAEMGKPLREARMEAARAATILRYSAGEAYRPAGEVYEPSVGNQTLYTRRRPLGVVGLITPWNFPIAIPVWKLAPALIYGNTVVLKLGYEAPRTGLHIAECFAEAGLPAGVLNVVTGAGSKVGAELVSNPDVRAISFTGSVAGRPRRTQRGDGPQLPRAARARRPQPVHRDGRRRARPRRRGGVCRGVLVGGPKMHRHPPDSRARAVYDAFREKLLARIAAAKVGDPADPDDRGRAGRQRERPFDEILAAIERGKAEGGTVAAGGKRADDDGLSDRPDRVRERRRRRVPLVRGGVRAGHLALPLLDRSTRRSRARTRSSSGSPPRSSPATSTPRSASRTSSRPASCTSTRRPRAPTSTSRSAASRARPGARTSKAGPRSSSTPRPSPSIRTRRLPERVLVTGAARVPRRLGRPLRARRR